MFLGIEIGGTKLQLGIGAGDGSDMLAIERLDVDPLLGAAGILKQIERAGTTLIEKQDVSRIGIGFGGPVDAAAGIVVNSHQIDGWENFPLVDWCGRTFGAPAVLGNDCDAAALAEARFGAGKDRRTVVFVTVGTGVGGGLVIDGQLHGKGRPAVMEIGHLRPGLDADHPQATVESLASGRGIEETARLRLTPDEIQRFSDDQGTLTTQAIAQAAADGHPGAGEVLSAACRALGWAVAQVISLIAPDVVVVGGGVSLIGEELFFAPLRAAVRRYVFPPLVDAYEIVPAALGDTVVVHGALALAAGCKS